MAQRLSNHLRDQIVCGLLKHRFDKDQADNRAVGYALALEAYELFYDKKTRKRMSQLPKGWLPSAGGVLLHFTVDGKKVSGLRYDLSFGMNDKPIVVLEKDYSRFDGIHINLPNESHREFATRLHQYERRSQELSGSRASMQRQLQGMLRKFTSVKKLIEAWPEVAPFIPKDQAPTVNALIPIKELNEQLKLP